MRRLLNFCSNLFRLCKPREDKPRFCAVTTQLTDVLLLHHGDWISIEIPPGNPSYDEGPFIVGAFVGPVEAGAQWQRIARCQHLTDAENLVFAMRAALKRGDAQFNANLRDLEVPF